MVGLWIFIYSFFNWVTDLEIFITTLGGVGLLLMLKHFNLKQVLDQCGP